MIDTPTLPLAHSKGRILVTLNPRHFIKTHKSGVRHAGIVVCTVDADDVVLAVRVDAAVAGRELTGDRVRAGRRNSRPSATPNAVGVLASG